LFAGADQERLICVFDADAAERLDGADGGLADEDDSSVEDASFDAAPTPTEFTAETRYEYDWPDVRPVCE